MEEFELGSKTDGGEGRGKQRRVVSLSHVRMAVLMDWRFSPQEADGIVFY